MFIVSSGRPDVELHTAVVKFGTARAICKELMERDCSFYYEPLPFYKAKITVADEHFPLVQNLVRCFE